MTKDKAVSTSDHASDEDWRAEGDAHTLMRAQEVRADKKRFAAAKAWAKKQMDMFNKIGSITD